MSAQEPPPWWRRTGVTTAVAVVAVAVTGAIAVGANVGVLGATGNRSTGQLSAAGDLIPPTSSALDVSSPAVPGSPTSPPAGSREFTVDEAGAVVVSPSASGLRLDAVRPASGWTSGSSQSASDGVAVSFGNGTRRLVFTASLTADGSVAGHVTETGAATGLTTPPGGHERAREHEPHEHYEGAGDDD